MVSLSRNPAGDATKVIAQLVGIVQQSLEDTFRAIEYLDDCAVIGLVVDQKRAVIHTLIDGVERALLVSVDALQILRELVNASTEMDEAAKRGGQANR